MKHSMASNGGQWRAMGHNDQCHDGQCGAGFDVDDDLGHQSCQIGRIYRVTSTITPLQDQIIANH